jgi:amino acid transporter
MPELTQQSAVRPELARDLGVSHASAVVVGTIIGSGIFLVPTEMMQAVGSAKLVYLAWLVGGLLSFFGALTYAELGAMKPQAGGEYVYVRDAYGPLGGFLYAWTWFVIAKPASIATIATGLVRILGTFSIFSFFSSNVVAVPFAVTWGQLVAIAAAILISLLNYFGVKRAGEFQLVFTVLKVAIILGIVVVCFSGAGNATGRGWSNFATTFTGAKGGIAGFMAALVAALWAYDGWNDLNMVAGEVKKPERNIPIALIAGVATVGLLYVLVNAGVQYVLPANAIAASPRPASDAVSLVVGRMGASIVSAGMAISMLVTLNGSRTFCRCSRWIFFLGPGRRASALSHPLGRHCVAGCLVDRSPVAGRKFPSALFARHLRGMALLYDRRQHGVRFPLARSSGGAAVSHVRLPCRTRAVRYRGRRSSLLHLPGRMAEFLVWLAGNPGWYTGFLLVSPPA